VKQFLDLNIPLHYLVLNAGVWDVKFAKTKQGHENTFGTNHLGHFLLTTLLLDKMKASAPARVVVVISALHRNAPIMWDDFMAEGKNWDSGRSYGQSKMANLLFAMELDKRLAEEAKDAKDRVIAVSLHPGVIKTDLLRDNTAGKRMLSVFKPFLKTIPQGAATTLYCCLAPDVQGGKYYADCAVAKIKPHKSCVPLDKSAARLWELSEKLVGSKKEETKDKEQDKEKETEKEKEPEKEKETDKEIDVTDSPRQEKEPDQSQETEEADA